MDKSKIELIALILLIAGGLNWLFAGLFGTDLLTMIFGSFARIIFILVGVAAIYMIYARFIQR